MRVQPCFFREDYRRLLQQYADFQKKKQRFEEADNKKFKEVWKMNESGKKFRLLGIVNVFPPLEVDF